MISIISKELYKKGKMRTISLVVYFCMMLACHTNAATLVSKAKGRLDIATTRRHDELRRTSFRKGRDACTCFYRWGISMCRLRAGKLRMFFNLILIS